MARAFFRTPTPFLAPVLSQMSLASFSLPNLFLGPLTAQPRTASGCGRWVWIEQFKCSHPENCSQITDLSALFDTVKQQLPQYPPVWTWSIWMRLILYDWLHSTSVSCFPFLLHCLDSSLDTEIAAWISQSAHVSPAMWMLLDFTFLQYWYMALVELDVSSLPGIIYCTLCLFPWKSEEAILLSLLVLPRPCVLPPAAWHVQVCCTVQSPAWGACLALLARLLRATYLNSLISFSLISVQNDCLFLSSWNTFLIKQQEITLLSLKKKVFRDKNLFRKISLLISHLSVFYVIIADIFLGAFYVLEKGLSIIKFILLIALGDRYCDYPYFYWWQRSRHREVK